MNIENEFGVTPLHVAASSGSCRCAQYLLKKKADVSVQDKESKWTPLHRAVFFLSQRNCRLPLLLLRHKANLHAPRDKDGLTPLQLLSQKLWFQRCNGNTLAELPDVCTRIRMRPGHNFSMSERGRKSIASARGSALAGQLFSFGSWDSCGLGWVTLDAVQYRVMPYTKIVGQTRWGYERERGCSWQSLQFCFVLQQARPICTGITASTQSVVYLLLPKAVGQTSYLKRRKQFPPPCS